MFFLLKQNTAYELRISDWSSDVALPISRGAGDGGRAWLCVRTPELRPVAGAGRRPVRTGGVDRGHHAHARWAAAASQLPPRADRRQRATASAAGTQRAAGPGGRGRVGQNGRASGMERGGPEA